MNTISVICAGHCHFNPGMISVDLGLWSLLARHGVRARTRFFSLYCPEDFDDDVNLVKRHRLPMRHEPLLGKLDEALAADTVLFWGDFLHARHYLHEDVVARLRELGVAASRRAAYAVARRHLLLDGAPDEVLHKTLIFGGSMLETRQSDYSDSLYVRNAKRLYQGARGIWMRDAHSARRASELSGRAHSHLGVDAATLLSPSDVRRLPRNGWSRGVGSRERMGVFFGGRTRGAPEELFAFARSVAKDLGMTAEWIPWIGAMPEEWTSEVSSGVLQRPGRPLMGDLMLALSQYRLIVTDTYHLCVNAWAQGTPAVCINGVDGLTPSAINQRKKDVFYSMYNARDFYVPIEYLRVDGFEAAMRKHLARSLADSRIAAGITRNISVHTAAVEKELICELAR